MSSATFDPGAYKRTTREQWQTAAEPWYRWGPTLEERESFEALHQMMGSLSESERTDVWEEVAQFETTDGFEGPCELIVSVGTAG
jgi:hypothetical protein